MDQNILTTLLMYNPWLEDPNAWETSVKQHMPQAFGFSYIQRFADFAETWSQSQKINLVVGSRQCGKSTLIWHTVSGRGPKLAYINCNELSTGEILGDIALKAAPLAKLRTEMVHEYMNVNWKIYLMISDVECQILPTDNWQLLMDINEETKMKKALITGITGKDGSYLLELLLKRI